MVKEHPVSIMISATLVSTCTCEDEPLATCAPKYDFIFSLVLRGKYIVGVLAKLVGPKIWTSKLRRVSVNDVYLF